MLHLNYFYSQSFIDIQKMKTFVQDKCKRLWLYIEKKLNLISFKIKYKYKAVIIQDNSMHAEKSMKILTK